jgi:hypothetical protein
MGTAAFVALLMTLCNKSFSATQFALLSAGRHGIEVLIGNRQQPVAGVGNPLQQAEDQQRPEPLLIFGLLQGVSNAGYWLLSITDKHLYSMATAVFFGFSKNTAVAME